MRKQFTVAAAVTLMCLIAGVAVAAEMKWGGEVFGAFNTHSMKDINDEFDAANANPGVSFDKISKGFTGGINLRMRAAGSWMVTAGWEPIFANTESNVPGENAQGNPASGNLKFNLNANSFQLGTGYFFPSKTSTQFGLGAGVGYYLSAGKIESEVEVTDGQGNTIFPIGTTDITGNTVGFHFAGMGEWMVSPGFAVTTTAGYRVAKITNAKLKHAGAEAELGDDVDYSGFIGRVGLAFYLPTGSR